MRQVVLISGRICNGKSELAKRLGRQFGYYLVRSSDIVKKEAEGRNLKIDRRTLQELGDELDRQTDSKWLVDALLNQEEKLGATTPVVVDNIRTGKQLEQFRRQQGWKIVHVHLYAKLDELMRRFERKIKKRPGEEQSSYSEADLLKDYADIEAFKDDADVRINTGRTDSQDTLVRVAARLDLYSPPNVRCVDVLVGGQYGSEGKGHVAAYLAREYDVLMRVGGPNAGHTVSSESGVYTYHQLPSGARDTSAQLLLGPGMTIHVESLLKEIEQCKVTPGRLCIDSQAMIIEQQDMDAEQEMVQKIASTGRGGGAAAARRIMGRKPGAVRLARNIPELLPYVGSTGALLEMAYRRGHSVLLEGTQGSGLSIFHGPYPHVTSRDTNVAGCLAEAGISPARVRRIIMVTRLTPIRVGDPEGEVGHTSGGLKHEVDFDTVAREAGLDPEEVKLHEITSTTKRNRRVGWFEWEQFRRACELNAPTDIALTFADYVCVKNRKARRFEQLTQDTIKFIEELERVAHAPVSLINTRFPRKAEEKIDLRTVIDRRDWTARRKD